MALRRDILPPSSGSKRNLLFKSSCWLLVFFSFFDPEDGGSMFLLNVGELTPHYMALHPRRTLHSHRRGKDRFYEEEVENYLSLRGMKLVGSLCLVLGTSCT
jgi:hypothetical protein